MSKLFESFQRPPHDYKASTLTFLELDLEKLKKDLRLIEEGRKHGEKDIPPAGSETFDDVEHAVIQLIEGEKKRTYTHLLDGLTTYAERLHGLDLEGRFSAIDVAAREGITEFRAKVEIGLDHLYSLRRRVSGLERDLLQFQNVHRLDRTAHYPSRGRAILQWGIIAVLLFIETMGNGYFLSKGNELGLIGGWGEALIIAFLNIGVSLLIGEMFVRNLIHRSFGRKFLGGVALLAYLAFAITFNLLVAHYRTAVGALFEDQAQEALVRFKAAPFGLADFQSWVLFGIGFLFSFITFLDGLYMDDPYPGYGDHDRRLEQARGDYAAEKAELIEDLRETKDEAVAAMEAARADLGKRRAEHLSILGGRTHLIRSFEQHLGYLERTANTLLSVYRRANCDRRSTSAPARFDRAWVLERPDLESSMSIEAWPQERLEQEIDHAKSALASRIEEVYDAYEHAFTSYQKLGDLAEENNVKAQAAA